MQPQSDIEKLKALLANPEAEIDPEWLREMARKYPFFALPAATSLRRNAPALGEEELRRMAMLLSLSSSDAAALRRLIEPDGDRFDGFYPPGEKPAAPSTDNAIDLFLNNYGQSEPGETELLEKLIFNPVPDYSSRLEKECELNPDTDTPASEQDDLINRFLANSGNDSAADTLDDLPIDRAVPAEPAAEPTKQRAAHPQQRKPQVEEPAGDSLFSESLAKIYIKTGQYEQAYEIINRLSLAFPEKNAYFADQLRFLRKLILNKQFKSKQNNQ